MWNIEEGQFWVVRHILKPARKSCPKLHISGQNPQVSEVGQGSGFPFQMCKTLQVIFVFMFLETSQTTLELDSRQLCPTKIARATSGSH